MECERPLVAESDRRGWPVPDATLMVCSGSIAQDARIGVPITVCVFCICVVDARIRSLKVIGSDMTRTVLSGLGLGGS